MTKQIEAKILGRDFSVGCPDNEEESVLLQRTRQGQDCLCDMGFRFLTEAGSHKESVSYLPAVDHG